MHELYNLAYMPGSWICPKCGFVLTKKAISAETGAMGTTEKERQSEPCPNDGEWLEPYPYRLAAEGLTARLKDTFPADRTYLLFDGIDCGQNAKPEATLWKGNQGGWAYGLNFGSGDENLYTGYYTEHEAREAAYTDVRERMADAACDVDVAIREAVRLGLVKYE